MIDMKSLSLIIFYLLSVCFLFLVLVNSAANGKTIDGTLYWPQHNEIKIEVYKWVVIRGKFFKVPTIGPVADFYWMCEVQDFVDQRGNHSPHTVCIVIDHDEIIRGA